MRPSCLRLRKTAENALQGVASRLGLQRLLDPLIERLAFVPSVYGPLLYNTPGDRTFEFCRTGYGPFVSDAIDRWTGDFLFLDIGANLGLFSLIAARNQHCRGGFAFEPVPGPSRTLELNLARNGASKITPVNAAIVDSAVADVHLAFNPRHSGMSKLTAAGHGTVRAAAISAPDLDRLVAQGRLPILAKIDVEGAEPEVWQTLKRTHFFARIAGLLIEISERNSDVGRLHDLLATLEADGFAEVGRAGDREHYDAFYRRHQHALGASL